MANTTGQNNFNLLRFAFASLVIFSHSYPLATGTESREPLIVLSRGQMTLGNLAVSCFFIISGYLIAQSWSRKPEVAAYLDKRVRRIYPGFLIAAVISAFIITPIFAENSFRQLITPEFAQDFILKALQLNFVQPAPAFHTNPAPGPVNGSLWSIPFEFWCYIGLMGMGLTGLLKRPAVLLIGLLSLIVLDFVVQRYHLKIGGGLLGRIFGYPTVWAQMLPYFVAGMVFFAFDKRIRYRASWAGVAGLLILAGCAIPYGLVFVLPFAASYVILWLAFIPCEKTSNFAKNGDYSFGIYLYAFPISQIIACLTGLTSPWMIFGLAWPASVLAGALSWHLVEHRFMKKTSPVAIPAAAA